MGILKLLRIVLAVSNVIFDEISDSMRRSAKLVDTNMAQKRSNLWNYFKKQPGIFGLARG